MRKLAILLIALAIGGPSFAADMALKAPPAPVATASSWTGFYVGGNVGGGWGSRNVNYSPNDPITVLFFPPPIALAPPQTSFTSSGAVGGPQLGYNWQLNRNWVVGLETDFDWSGMKGSGSVSGTAVGPGPTFFPFTNTMTERVDWFGTVRARLGYLPTNNLLTYFTGGFAYGRIHDSGNDVFAIGILSGGPGPTGFTCVAAGAPCFSGSSTTTGTGGPWEPVSNTCL
jgi:outer membrane immunogenic protein